jgi:hypothetical protein
MESLLPMTDHDAKQELVRFLEKRVFDPVLKARPNGRSPAERERLEHVQRATRAEIERFRGYGSAREVLVNFRPDLTSQPAKRVHAELAALGLPTINDIRDEFERRAAALLDVAD